MSEIPTRQQMIRQVRSCIEAQERVVAQCPQDKIAKRALGRYRKTLAILGAS